jgi:hypothetical protein
MLYPLHLQYDWGFGAMADAYLAAANGLENSDWPEKRFNGHLPVAFLRRHAVELYLKSGIVIFHRRLGITDGSDKSDGHLMVKVAGEWRPFKKVHNIADLFAYWSTLFETHHDFLVVNTRTDWKFPAELPAQIATIQEWDPDSTLARYPLTLKSKKDEAKCSKDEMKGSMTEITTEEVIARLGNAEETTSTFVFVDKDDNIVATHTLLDDPLSVLNVALRNVSALLSGAHAAMRGELTDGR